MKNVHDLNDDALQNLMTSLSNVVGRVATYHGVRPPKFALVVHDGKDRYHCVTNADDRQLQQEMAAAVSEAAERLFTGEGLTRT